MTWRYVIMANGSGKRWADYLGIPKQLLVVEGETLLARLARQLRELGCEEVVISASDPRLEVPGIRRHSPLRNEIELDRFVPELIVSRTCFLYGDTFYTDAALARIVAAQPRGVEFFATTRSIVAVKSGDENALRITLAKVREDFEHGMIPKCRGWELYDAHTNAGCGVLPAVMTVIYDRTGDVNAPEDAERFLTSDGA